MAGPRDPPVGETTSLKFSEKWGALWRSVSRAVAITVFSREREDSWGHGTRDNFRFGYEGIYCCAIVLWMKKKVLGLEVTVGKFEMQPSGVAASRLE